MPHDASSRQKPGPAVAPRLTPEGESREVRDLVARLARQEIAAWEVLWERYAGFTLAVARSLIRSRNWFALAGEEEDVVTEGFMRLRGGVGKFRGDSYAELEQFIRTNTVFTCQGKLRRRAGREESLEEVAEQAVGTSQELEEIAECTHLLEQAVAGLPPELGQIVSLNLEGCEAKEIATLLGVSAQSVYQRKHEALCLLRDRLKQDEFWEHCAPHVSSIRLAPPGGLWS